MVGKDRRYFVQYRSLLRLVEGISFRGQPMMSLQHDMQLFIHTDGDEIVFVHIQSNISFSRFFHGGILLLKLADLVSRMPGTFLF